MIFFRGQTCSKVFPKSAGGSLSGVQLQLPWSFPIPPWFVSEQILLERMDLALQAFDPKTNAETAEWRILSARPLPAGSKELHFGSRIGTASQVALLSNSGNETAWVESLSNGWLFLLPAESHGWLLSVGGPPQSLLEESSLIRPQISCIAAEGQTFSSHPRIAEPICGPGWLACGSAAFGFDPLCGDGSGHAAREAILASAVVRAAGQGGSIGDLTAHYRARLLAGLHRHLATCAEFYRSGGTSAWWQEQVRATEEGLHWSRTQIPANGEFKYRLEGFSLHTLAD